MKKYWVGNRKKRYYGELWGNTDWGGGDYENPVRLSMCDSSIEIEKQDAIMAGGDELWESANPFQGSTFDGTTWWKRNYVLEAELKMDASQTVKK